MMFAAFAKTFVPLLIIFPGLLALVLNAPIDEADKALPWSLKTYCRGAYRGLCLSQLLQRCNRLWIRASMPRH